MNYKIALGLGGNLQDVKQTIKHAVELLKIAGLSDVKISSFYLNKALNCIPNTPDFTNAILIGNWQKDIMNLFGITKELEVYAGRPKNHRNDVSRTLDIDIILFGDMIRFDDILTIPHPRARNRDFVLIPLSEIASDWIFPDTKKSVKETLEEFYLLGGSRDRLLKL